MTDEQSGRALAAEVTALRDRLAAAEEALRAISTGNVDAVVAGDRGEHVYTLQGADRIYRQLIETMSEGAATLSADGVILYCNVRLAEMLARPLDQVLGTALRDYLSPEDQRELDSVLAQAGSQPVRREIGLSTGEDNRVVPTYLSASRLQSEATGMAFCLVFTDLTGKKNHERMVESERLARSILEQAAEVIVVCDEVGRVTRTSRVAERYCDAGTLHRPFAEAFPLRSSASHPFQLAPALQGEKLRNVDVTLDRHGQTIDLILNAGPLLGDQELLGCVVTLTDITERKRSEDELRARERALEEAQRVAHLGSWDQAPETGAITWSAELCRIYGVDPKLPVPGFDELAPFYTPESWARLQTAVGNALQSGAPIDLDVQIVRTDGEVIWVATRGEAVRDAAGQIVGTRGTVHDITGRKRAENALRLRSAALTAAANAIVITERDSTIVWANPAFTTLTGYALAEAIGKSPRELIKSGVHDRAFYKQLWDTILAGEVWTGEITNRRKDGSLYAEELTVTPLMDDRGDITHFIAIKRDLTSERALQAQFLQSQKMETVGRLAAGIAHDFNNLLTVINGTADLALTPLREGDPLRAELREVRQAGERAASLTRQLLAFSRQQVMKFEVLNLSALVTDLQGMLQRLIGEDISLEVLPANDLGSVMADPVQIEQVILNLVVNARDAMPGGGRLTIETRNVELDEAYAVDHPSVQPGRYVMLTISDTGVGMDGTTRARIFEPFFSTKALGEGTGLGLSTVYGIVKQSGGSIWVYSEPGTGTTFRIYLSRVESVAPASKPAPRVASVQGTETVLIVEDEEAVRRLAKRILEMAGYTVLTASDGSEALALLERHEGPVHLTLTDMIMPGMNGRELAARLKDIRPQMKIIFTSGYSADSIQHSGALDTDAHFLGKPYSVAQLTRTLREVLDS